jgi:tetratricopeptide (TPR) repeat protein
VPGAARSFPLTAPAAPTPELEARQGKAIAAYKNGDLAQAQEICLRIISDAPEFPPSHYLLGLIAGKNGETVRAIALLFRVVQLDPKASKARTELSAILRDEGRNAEAIEMLRAAVERNPKDAAALNDLGQCHHFGRSYHAAVECFMRAIALEPNVSGYHANLAISWEHLGRFEKAVTAFRRALALGLDLPDIHTRLGKMHHLLGERDEAARCFANARAKATGVRGFLELATVLSSVNEWDEAEADLRRAVALDPRSPEAHQQLGTAMRLRGRFEEARGSYRRAIELNPHCGTAYLGLVSTRKVSESDRPLLERMESIALGGLTERSRLDLHYALGKAYADLKTFGDAIKHYSAANAIAANWVRTAGLSFDRERCAAQADKSIATFTTELFRKRREMGGTVLTLSSADSRLSTGERVAAAVSRQSELPVLIVGMIRSGTTLVEQIVSSHPDAAPGGELPFWRRLSNAPKSVAMGTFDNTIAEAMASEYLRMLGHFAGNAKRVTDKMPLNFWMLGLIHLVFPNARIIHCRRNPLDTCLSIYTTPLGVPSDFAHHRGNIVFYYKQYLRLMEHWRRVLPRDRFLEVDYEALVENPEPATRRMLDFCGLEWDEACLKHEENPRAVATPSTWQVRQPMYKSSVGRWRDYEPWLGEFRELAATGSFSR